MADSNELAAEEYKEISKITGLSIKKLLGMNLDVKQLRDALEKADKEDSALVLTGLGALPVGGTATWGLTELFDTTPYIDGESVVSGIACGLLTALFAFGGIGAGADKTARKGAVKKYFDDIAFRKLKAQVEKKNPPKPRTMK